MGCNCKASQYVRQTKKKYGYAPETRENIPTRDVVKMSLQAIAIWVVMILSFPIIMLSLLFLKVFKQKRGIKFFKAIRVRL